MENILYKSTRDSQKTVTASQAILKGLSDDGGLFVPVKLPKLDRSIKELSGMGYKEIAYEVMKLFFSDFTEEELKKCIDSAYDSKFDTDEIVPIANADGAFYHKARFYGYHLSDRTEREYARGTAARGLPGSIGNAWYPVSDRSDFLR